MNIIESPQAMQAVSQGLRQQGKKIGLIPTMGNLHAGHLSLITRVKPLVDQIIVSIFVNPTQFGPQEDFANYPRTFEQDCAQLKNHGVDIVFAPKAEEMYAGDLATQTFIKVPDLSDILCGHFRPGHFQGVATIVCKLFQIVQPHQAIFGEKDYQQLLVIRRMVSDLCLPVQILGAPIIRENNGLALSSRNQYLSAEQREQAARLYQELNLFIERAKEREDYETLLRQSTENLNSAGFRTDYIALRRQDNLQTPLPNDKKLIVLAAAFLGKTRLIDNILFEKS